MACLSKLASCLCGEHAHQTRSDFLWDFFCSLSPYLQHHQLSNINSWTIVAFRGKEMEPHTIFQHSHSLTRLPSSQTHHLWQKICLLSGVTPSRRHLSNRCRGEPPSGIADLIHWLISTELQSTALPHRLV
ncbi:hypothetical protein GOODEAATRI_018266 [Goodea atripinnis]|uniref:Uncharacterized protein n=1 Tax=Goodea atripinnis TaxID=208336 RepID=A0ABV0P5U5_9TELE